MSRISLVLLLLAVPSCTLVHQPSQATSPAGRLRPYADLNARRQLVLADFEDTHTVIRWMSDQNDSLTYATHRPHGGQQSLAWKVGSGVSQLSFDTRLVRDWTRYTLALISLRTDAPVAHAAVVLSDSPRSDTVRTSMNNPVQIGDQWQAVRVDIGQAGLDIDTDNVRSLRLAVDMHDTADATVWIDDIVLAEVATDYVGSPQAQAGQWYVRRQGDHVRLGRVGQYEWWFDHRGWCGWFVYDDQGRRSNNLAGPAGLGPAVAVIADQQVDQQAPYAQPRWVLPAGAGHDGWVLTDPSAYTEVLGSTVHARLSVIQANPMRAVVRLTRTYADTPASTPSARQQWQYTVYPDGSTFVRVRSVTQHDCGFRPEYMGVALTSAADAGLMCISRSADHERDSVALFPEPLAYVAHIPKDSGSDADSVGNSGVGVVMAAADPQAVPHQYCLVPTDGSHAAHSAAQAAGSASLGWSDVLARPEHTWAVMLIAGDDITSQVMAETAIIDYVYPPGIDVSVGKLVTDHAGDVDGDGFDQGSGCYVVQSEAGEATCTLKPGQTSGYRPKLEVLGLKDRRCWVYIDGQVSNCWSLTESGSVLVVPDEGVRKAMTVEVVSTTGNGGGSLPIGQIGDR